jgi:hypothetical protein
MNSMSSSLSLTSNKQIDGATTLPAGRCMERQLSSAICLLPPILLRQRFQLRSNVGSQNLFQIDSPHSRSSLTHRPQLQQE